MEEAELHLEVWQDGPTLVLADAAAIKVRNINCRIFLSPHVGYERLGSHNIKGSISETHT